MTPCTILMIISICVLQLVRLELMSGVKTQQERVEQAAFLGMVHSQASNGIQPEFV